MSLSIAIAITLSNKTKVKQAILRTHILMGFTENTKFQDLTDEQCLRYLATLKQEIKKTETSTGNSLL